LERMQSPRASTSTLRAWRATCRLALTTCRRRRHAPTQVLRRACRAKQRLVLLIARRSKRRWLLGRQTQARRARPTTTAVPKTRVPTAIVRRARAARGSAAARRFLSSMPPRAASWACRAPVPGSAGGGSIRPATKRFARTTRSRSTRSCNPPAAGGSPTG
jgi:hypothetical protein